jgi:anaerobic magnesium-protoporphyrin IX monomethyl ester cyclase
MKVSDIISRTEGQREVDVVLMYVDPLFVCTNIYYNIGLLYIAEYLKKQNYRVKCIGLHEINHMSPEQIKCYFLRTKPSLVGFYTMSENIHLVEDFASLIKKWSPGTDIVIGGPYATSLREKSLNHQSFDICALGEGEITMSKLADWKIRKTGNLEDIPGIIYRKDGKCELTSEPVLIEDLDSLPVPDQDMVHFMKYPFFPVSTGRGCPYKCLFCFQKVHGTYRPRSIKSIVDEIISNLETNLYKGFTIIDDLFVSDPRRIEEFVKLLGLYRKKSGRKFMFFCQGRINILDKHPELIEMLKSVGLIRIQVGFESGDDNMLRIYNKQITTEQIRRVVKNIIDIGEVMITGNFLLGGPGENIETIESTKELIKELITLGPGIFECTVCYIVPYPGTKIAENPEKYGLELLNDRLKFGAGNGDVCLVSESLGVNEQRKALSEINREMYLCHQKNVKNVDRKLILKMIEWYVDYTIVTMWSQFILNNNLLTDYYNHMTTKRYRSFNEIPPGKLAHWYPQRVIENRIYSEDGRKMLMPAGIEGETALDIPEEILIYELSSGKISIKNMIKEFKTTFNSDLADDEILEKYFIPFFRKLDQSYHLVFHSCGS